MGGRALARHDERREALDVVNHVLGGGLSSRLFEEIRERRGLAYSVYSGVSGYADAGVFQLYAGTQPDHADEVIELMHRELDRLTADGIDDEELEVATGYLAGSFELGLEDTGARMARNAGQLVTTGAVREVADQVDRWERVDQAAVRDGDRRGLRRRTARRHRRPHLTRRVLRRPVRRWTPPIVRLARSVASSSVLAAGSRGGRATFGRR